MSFYDQLGDKYDMMIRWKTRLEREAPFFQRLFTENRIKRVLDLACGTGHHAQLFHNWGCEVVGVDPSLPLLQTARANLNGVESDNLTFVESDFLHFQNVVKGEFDIVLTLGNALPHILTESDLRKTLASIYATLKPGGVFVVQNRNYDRLIQSRERFLLPSTYRQADSEQIFFRFNDFERNKVRFNVVHFTRVGEGWIHEVFSTELKPWLQADLARLLEEAGFQGVDFYGDFSGTPFDNETSADLVVLARKLVGNG